MSDGYAGSTNITGESKRQCIDRLAAVLKTERDSGWRSHYQDLADYILPRRVRFNTLTDRNRGDKRNQKIVNSHATLALRTMRSGMMSGVTSPARPWFRLTTPDPDLAEFGTVKEWLHTVTRRMYEMLARSNFYNVLSPLYGDLGCFGTGAISMLENISRVVRCEGYPIGSYVLATSDDGLVDTFIREFAMTVRQVVMRFGDNKATPAMRWMPFSASVRQQWDAGNYETPIEVVHAIMPNVEYDGIRALAKYKRFSSCYYEAGTREKNTADRDRFLRESGFDRFPILAPRWDLASPDDVYGSSCPGMDALGDIKSMQLLEKRKAQANEKAYNPPLVGPSSLKVSKVSSLPGDVTYEDVREGSKGLRPLYEVRPDTQGLLLDIEAHQKRISRAFYEDLFLMLAQDARAQPPTAEEIRAREGEKLLMLGPVLERLNDELLGPAIDIAFDVMVRRRLLPPPPPEIQGENLKVEYISIIAQAQKMMATGALDRFLGAVGTIAERQAAAGVSSTVLDKVDLDQAVDEYGDQMGVPPRIIVPDDKVVEIRKARAQREAAAQRAAVGQQMADSAKSLSQADTEGKNALTDTLASLQGNAAA
jgi:hypothetical protein